MTEALVVTCIRQLYKPTLQQYPVLFPEADTDAGKRFRYPAQKGVYFKLKM